MPTILLPFLLATLLSACATSPEGRAQLHAPEALQGFSAVYSELDLQLLLVTAAEAPVCVETECVADREFDQRILSIGHRLADTAFREYPDLISRFSRFEFIVADKAEAGSASSAAGTVVIYRGLRHLALDDAALAFVLAREMSHIVAGHHDENVATSLLVAIATQILFPALNIGRGIAALSGSAATTAASSAAATSAAATLASFAGSRALRASDRPQQVLEAEAIAMKLLVAAGWNGRETADQLETLRNSKQGDPEWTEELRDSSRRIASLMQGPVLLDLPEPEPGPEQRLAQIATLLADLPPPLISKPF